MTDLATVRDQICQFFGGPYNSTLHAYVTPTVSGLSMVRRAWAKQDNEADYFYGQTSGTMTGCQMIVAISETRDHRVALPGIVGRRMTRFQVDMYCFVISHEPYAEDTQAFVDTLRDAIIAKIRTDPTLGTGGIENNAFQVGEGREEGGGEIATTIGMDATDMQLTKALLVVSYEAHSFDVA